MSVKVCRVEAEVIAEHRWPEGDEPQVGTDAYLSHQTLLRNRDADEDSTLATRFTQLGQKVKAVALVRERLVPYGRVHATNPSSGFGKSPKLEVIVTFDDGSQSSELAEELVPVADDGSALTWRDCFDRGLVRDSAGGLR